MFLTDVKTKWKVFFRTKKTSREIACNLIKCDFITFLTPLCLMTQYGLQSFEASAFNLKDGVVNK